MFDADQIRAATFIRHLEFHDTLGSTNDRAAELARQADIELPALVVTRIQTAGRGRGKNAWWSADGAITFSLLLDIKTTGVSSEKWPQLSLTTAVAVCDALQREAPQAKIGIKWPNDVLLDGKKVCGILIESPGGTAPAKDRLVIGIGVNVNNSLHGPLGNEILNGFALRDVTGQQHDLQTVLIATLAALETRITQLRKNAAQLMEAWRTLDQLTDKRLIVESGKERFEGTGEQLSDDGALVVNTASGLKRFYSGSVFIK